jgi:hypothetical protein
VSPVKKVTSTNTSVDGQLAVGCVPCDVPAGPPIRFVRGCAYSCPVNQADTMLSTYCRSTALAADGITCPSTCGLCEHALSQLLVTQLYDVGVPIVGLYPRGCSNGAGRFF